MKENEFKAFSEFIHKLLYEVMTDADYHMIMTRLGARQHIRRYTAICHNPQSRNYNLAFNSKTRSYTCFSGCSCSYSLLSLIKKVKGLNTYKALEWLCDELNIPFNFKEQVKPINNNIYNWQRNLGKYSSIETEVKDLIAYPKDVLKMFEDKYPQEWLDYGITEDILDKYEIMWYNYFNQIVIPCYNENGELIGIRIRNTDPDSRIKYKPLALLDGTEFNFPTNNVFYGENFTSNNIRRTKSAILVESEKTVLKFESWYGADKNICLGLYGSNLSQIKLKKLLSWGAETFYIALDSDFTETQGEEFDKFVTKVNKIYGMLKPYSNNIYVIYNNLEFQDCYKYSITDYTKSQFEQLWESKERIVT